MEPIIYKQYRFTWHYYVVTVIALLIFGSMLKGESDIFALILVGIGFMLGMWATNNNLGKQIVLSKEGITDDKGLFRSWKSIDHCYFTAGKRRFLTLVYKNKEELSDTISFDNYPVRKTDLERAINQMAGASSITMAAATFGLVAGSLLGGPLGETLIRRHHLSEPSANNDAISGEVFPESQAEDAPSGSKSFQEYLHGACILIIAMSLGTGLSRLLALTGITFPTYFGALLVACILRNLCGLSQRWTAKLHVGAIVSIGDICLQLFLGMAMASLRLWELASLALPLTLILVSHVAFLALFGAFVAFPLLGKDYDSAVLVSGLCGFGLGATPNAMANMSAVCFKYRYAVKPFIIVPIVGAMFVDIINTGIITLFLNFLTR